MKRVPTDRPASLAHRSFLAGFGLLVVLGTGLSPAVAQTPTDRVVAFQENASGFQLLGSVHEADLGAGQAMQLAVTLVEGADYIIVGFCDPTCSNLDLSLFDPEDMQIQDDRLPDAEPVLMFTAEDTGPFTVQVDAVACSSATCDISVGVFGSTDEAGVVPGEDMESRMGIVAAEFETLGFRTADQPRRGALASEDAVMVPVELEEGVNYRIAAVCDQDCPDLDLRLLDPNGIEVDGDYLDDALPILAHLADTTAEYSVDVRMVACFVQPCQFRLEVFSQVDAEVPGMKTFSGRLISHETTEGQLLDTDDLLEDAYVDVYEVEAEAGQRIVADLRSPEFDTLLRLIPPEGKPIENDDFRGEAEHSHIEFLATSSGLHTIQVTSYVAFAQGEYVVQIAVVQ